MLAYFAAPITAWFVAQLIKFASQALKGDIDFSWFWRSGGMPSSHTSLVTALFFVILVTEGVSSPLFGVVSVMTMIVIYDAVGVRRAVHRLIPTVALLAEEKNIKFDKSLLQTKGHTGNEVGFGVVNGAIVGLLFTGDAWFSSLSFLSAKPKSSEQMFFAIVFSLAFLTGLAVFLAGYRVASRKLPTYSKLRRLAFWSLIIPSIIAGLILISSRGPATVLGWRAWLWLIFNVVVIIQIILAFKWYGRIPGYLAEEKKHFVEEKKKRNKRKKQSTKKRKKK